MFFVLLLKVSALFVYCLRRMLSRMAASYVQGSEATQWKSSMVFREPPIPAEVTVTADTSNYYPTLQQLHNLKQLAMAQSRFDRNEEVAVQALLLELSGGLKAEQKRVYGLTGSDALSDIDVLYYRDQVCKCHQHTSTQHGAAKTTCSRGPHCLPFMAIVSVCFFCMVNVSAVMRCATHLIFHTNTYVVGFCMFRRASTSAIL